MKKIINLFFTAFLVLCHASAWAQNAEKKIASAADGQTSKRTTTAQASAERYIRKSEAQWAESVATGDTATVERILAGDFVGVDPKGNLYDKAKMISDTRDAPKYFVSNHLDTIQIRFYGKMAIAQGSETWERRGSGERGRFVWTDTWLFRKGRWQIIAAEDLIAAPLSAKNPVKK